VVLAEFLGIYFGACAEVRWGEGVEGFGWVEGIGVLRLRAARFAQDDGVLVGNEKGKNGRSLREREAGSSLRSE
jgi:hypothetical protein